jgi:hypothetical protein
VLSQQAVGFPVKWLRDDIMPVTQLGDAATWGDTNLSIRLGLPPFPADTSRGNGSRGNATASASPAAVFAGIHVQIPGTVRKRLLGAFYTKKRIIYQDRLGTNIEKDETKDISAGRHWRVGRYHARRPVTGG